MIRRLAAPLQGRAGQEAVADQRPRGRCRPASRRRPRARAPARRRMASASRILAEEGVSRLPKLLWLISATLGSSPKPRTISAARIAVSAISARARVVADAGVGDEQGPGVEHQRVDGRGLAASRAAGRSPRRCGADGSASSPTGPASMASASPRASITAAITVRRVRTPRAPPGGVTPLRPTRSR